tara:strand:+ start:89 stop:934 length:846 start_codon:yes stop_codon:yes gene_type:complete
VTASSPADSKRTKQVKVNFNEFEFNEFNKIVNASHSDRSSFLRNLFFKWSEMKQYTSLLEKSIIKAKNSIDEIHSEAIKNEGDPYYILREELTNLRRIKDDFRDLVQKDKESEFKNQESLNKTEDILDKLSKTYEKIESTQLELDKAEQQFDSQLVDIKKDFVKVVSSISNKIPNYEDENIESIEITQENNLNKKNKDIVIFNISEKKHKYELIDKLNNGSPIITNFGKLETDNVENTLEFEFINGGIYALQASIEKLSDSMYLFSPKEIRIDKVTKRDSK